MLQVVLNHLNTSYIWDSLEISQEPEGVILVSFWLVCSSVCDGHKFLLSFSPYPAMEKKLASLTYSWVWDRFDSTWVYSRKSGTSPESEDNTMLALSDGEKLKKVWNLSKCRR